MQHQFSALFQVLQKSPGTSLRNMEVFETESPETSVKTEIEDSHSHILLSNHFLERKKRAYIDVTLIFTSMFSA